MNAKLVKNIIELHLVHWPWIFSSQEILIDFLYIQRTNMSQRGLKCKKKLQLRETVHSTLDQVYRMNFFLNVLKFSFLATTIVESNVFSTIFPFLPPLSMSPEVCACNAISTHLRVQFSKILQYLFGKVAKFFDVLNNVEYILLTL